jgi:hypothetical protein
MFEKGYQKEVCESMICPNLGRMVDYTRWMSLAGFSISSAEDITRNVQKTWSYCIEALKKPAVRAFLKICNSDIRRFVNSFPLMLRAYNTGTMSYGMITGRKTISDISFYFPSHSN